MKKFLLLMIAVILSISFIGCFGSDESTPASEPQSNKESIEDSISESESVSTYESISESISESIAESSSESESASEESIEESQPEIEYVTVIVKYQLSIDGEIQTETHTVQVGTPSTITLPSITPSPSEDYDFAGWKIVETGETFGIDTLTIEITTDKDLTIVTVFKEAWIPPY